MSDGSPHIIYPPRGLIRLGEYPIRVHKNREAGYTEHWLGVRVETSVKVGDLVRTTPGLELEVARRLRCDLGEEIYGEVFRRLREALRSAEHRFDHPLGFRQFAFLEAILDDLNREIKGI